MLGLVNTKINLKRFQNKKYCVIPINRKPLHKPWHKTNKLEKDERNVKLEKDKVDDGLTKLYFTTIIEKIKHSTFSKKINLILSFLICFLIVLSFKFQNNIILSKPPQKLNKIDTSLTNLNWNLIVEYHHNNFKKEGWNKSNGSDSASKIRSFVVDVFQGDFLWYVDHNKYKKKLTFRDKKFYNLIVKPFFKSQEQQRLLYNWIKPLYIESYKNLPQFKKDALDLMLKHSKSYLNSFDYNSELAVYKKSPETFYHVGPKGKRGTFRLIEAFIFRRINNKEMTKLQILNWVNTIQKEISSIKKL